MTRIKPTAIKKLEGTYRKDRHGTKDPINYGKILSIPEPPPGLTDSARDSWPRISQILINSGVLQEIDIEPLAAYCNEMAVYWDATLICQKEGFVKEDGRRHSANIVARDALKNAMALMSLFGITPVHREKLRVEAKPEEKDPFNTYF